MKNKLKVVGICALAFCVLSTVPKYAEAADGGEYKTNAKIKFSPAQDITDPVDPTDPKTPVKPIDPTDPNGPKPGTNGPLSIDYASSLNFGVQQITSVDKVYNAAAQTFNGSRGEGPNYVQVTDNRGTETGWTLKVKQEGQFVSSKGKELTGAELKFNNGVINTASSSTKPSELKTTFSLSPDGKGVAEKIMAAKSGEGAGTYLLVFGDDKTGGNSISLSVPGKTTKYADEYATKLTWTLEDIPTTTN